MSYKIGDTIGKYTVTRNFDSANGGQCQWGFAKYGEEEFFIKKFLAPVYPGDKAPGSEAGKQKKREQCQEFEKKQSAIIKALSDCGDGGLVVRTIDCFKHGNDSGKHYFKVSQKVDTSSMSNMVHTLEVKKRLFVMLTAASAVSILHKNGIIHLDLKPDNILIQEYGSNLIAKVIDFDSSVLEGESISSETLVGDIVYYSPEFATYINDKSGKTPIPTKKSDIFSLGLIFCKYWTGNLPTSSLSYDYAHESVLKGEKLSIPRVTDGAIAPEGVRRSRLSGTLVSKSTIISADPISNGIQKIIQNMLHLDPETRWSIEQIHQGLKHLYNNGKLPEIDTKSKATESRKRINFGRNLK